MANNATVATDLEPFLRGVAIERLRRLLPILLFGVIVSLLASPAAKVPVPAAILVINGLVILVTIAMWAVLRHDRLPPRFAHDRGPDAPCRFARSGCREGLGW